MTVKIKPKTDPKATAGAGNSGNLFVRVENLQYRKVSELRCYAANPRKHSEKQLAILGANIAEFGFVTPIVTSDDEIVAGEARVEAARRLDLDEVPTISVNHLTPRQIRAFRLADNRIAELGTWDLDALRNEIDAISEFGELDIELLGWETAEIDVLLSEISIADADSDEADLQPELEAPVTCTGDLWALGKHRLICGSSRDRSVWATLMGGASAAMVFTDPPYNVPINGHVSRTKRHAEFPEAAGEMPPGGFVDFLTDTVDGACEYLKDGGIADLCMDHRHLPEIMSAIERIGLSRINLCVWNKGSGGMGSLYRSQHELVLITKKGNAPHTNNVQLGKYGRNRTNVWDYPGANRFSKTRSADLADHPTVKPIALVADAVLDVTRTGEVVVDAFMGSGTTLLAAERTRP